MLQEFISVEWMKSFHSLLYGAFSFHCLPLPLLLQWLTSPISVGYRYELAVLNQKVREWEYKTHSEWTGWWRWGLVSDHTMSGGLHSSASSWWRRCYLCLLNKESLPVECWWKIVSLETSLCSFFVGDWQQKCFVVAEPKIYWYTFCIIWEMPN